MKFLFILIFLGGSTALAQERPPLFELGLLGGGGLIPHYPGSDQVKIRPLLLPYFTYQGRFIRRDDIEGARIRVARKFGLKFDIGFFGAFFLNSEDNDVRRGMEDIGWLVASGPRIVIPYYWSEDLTFRLFLPIRASLEISTTADNYTFRGFDFAPAFNIDYKDIFVTGDKFLALISSNWVTEDYSDLYYGVPAAFAKVGRPAYNTRGGYLGSNFFTGLIMPIHSRAKLFLLSNYSNFTGSANEDSPLFVTPHFFGAIVGVSWVFWRTERRGED